ncbi:hypothetical protein [Pseudonocardia sp. GCM10023141]|uniref:hypothetical protein n=1 Tax=Pseudonocardia sp. GCM10023141 TaxID=3252653 RepID=UPI00360B0188
MQRLRGRMDHARDSFERALSTALAIGHPLGEGAARLGLGEIHAFRGKFDVAAEHYATAQEIAGLAGFRSGDLDAQLGLGWGKLRRGSPAVVEFKRALDMAREAGDHRCEQVALNGLGQDHKAHGRLDLATDTFEAALRSGDAHGDRPGDLEGAAPTAARVR